MEHERLRHRLTELQSQLPPRTSASSPSISTTSAIYATSTIPSQSLLPATGPPYSKSLDHPSTRYALSSANYEDILSGSRDAPESAKYGRCSLYSSSVHVDEDSEEGVKKKKVQSSDGMWKTSSQFSAVQLKKSHSVEQYVCITCGRTDSPEWRKVSRSRRCGDNNLTHVPRGLLGPRHYATHVG